MMLLQTVLGMFTYPVRLGLSLPRCG